ARPRGLPHRHGAADLVARPLHPRQLHRPPRAGGGARRAGPGGAPAGGPPPCAMAWPVGEDQPSLRPDGGGQSRPEAGGAERLPGPGERGALAPGLCCRAPAAVLARRHVRAAREPTRWRAAMTAGKPAFYITTPIYYVNDDPHIGHAYTTLA